MISVDEIECQRPPTVADFGNREKVIALALKHPRIEEVRFLADRDTGCDQPATAESLLYTDFPAIESYCLSESVVRKVMRHVGRLPTASIDPAEREVAAQRAIAALVVTLGRCLPVLFRFRIEHRQRRVSVEFPRDLKKFIRLDPGGACIDEPKLCAHLAVSAIGETPLVTTMDTLRPVAYGHDIARLIFALWPDLRTKSGLAGAENLERLLLSFVMADDLRHFPLFGTLASWAA